MVVYVTHFVLFPFLKIQWVQMPVGGFMKAQVKNVDEKNEPLKYIINHRIYAAFSNINMYLNFF